MKILVVDDNKDCIKVIQAALKDMALTIISAQDGTDGYDAYLRHKPELVITDIQMPRTDGLKMMKDIWAHNPRVRTIFMSGDMDEYRALLESDEKQHPVTLLEKPFSLKSLTNLVTVR